MRTSQFKPNQTLNPVSLVMVSQPRFVSLFFYGLGWGVVPALIFTGMPSFLVFPVILIQFFNAFSVLRMPVEVSVRGSGIECRFPLTRTTKTLDLASTEWYFQRNPIRIFRFSDSVVLRSRTINVQIWRMGTKDFDGICDSLKSVKA